MESSLITILVQAGAVGICFVLCYLLYKFVTGCQGEMTKALNKMADVIGNLSVNTKENTEVLRSIKESIK